MKNTFDFLFNYNRFPCVLSLCVFSFHNYNNKNLTRRRIFFFNKSNLRSSETKTTNTMDQFSFAFLLCK